MKSDPWLPVLACTILLFVFSHCRSIEDRMTYLERRIAAESNFRSHDISVIYQRLDEINDIMISNLSRLHDRSESNKESNRKDDVDEKFSKTAIVDSRDDISVLRRAFINQKKYVTELEESLKNTEDEFKKFKTQSFEEMKLIKTVQENETNKLEKEIQNLKQNNALLERNNNDLNAKLEVIAANISALQGKVVLLHSKESYQKFSSCKDALETGFTTSGVFHIAINEVLDDVEVYCDQQTDGGGWTVFQRRQDGSEDFYRSWEDYMNGFGHLKGEFWLGNKYIHAITAKESLELRIDLEDFEGNKVFAKYKRLRLMSEKTNFTLEVSGYDGNAGDSLKAHNGRGFSTKDRDHDSWSTGNCAVSYTGAWWYNRCHDSNLNGEYYQGENSPAGKGVIWYYFKNTNTYSLKFTEMKIR